MNWRACNFSIWQWYVSLCRFWLNLQWFLKFSCKHRQYWMVLLLYTQCGSCMLSILHSLMLFLLSALFAIYNMRICVCVFAFSMLLYDFRHFDLVYWCHWRIHIACKYWCFLKTFHISWCIVNVSNWHELPLLKCYDNIRCTALHFHLWNVQT